MDYKKIIKTILLWENMSQSDLAKKLNKERQYISRILNDNSVSDINVVIDIFEALGYKLQVKKDDKIFSLEKFKKD